MSAIGCAGGGGGRGFPPPGDEVGPCPGTSTCRLGITSSKIIGAKLNGGSADLRIRASGCHNGCAQPETGDIGIYGEGKRLHGKLIPHYQMYFGGDGRAHGGLGLKGPSVPAARVETAVSRVQQAYLKERSGGESFFHWTRRRGKESFTELLADLLKIAPEELPGVLHDHGEAADFKVLQLGGGECAGAAQELVSSQFAEAAYERDCRNAFASQHKYSEALECAEAILRLIGQSLLLISGAKKLDAIAEIARVLPGLRPENTALAQRLSALTQGIDALKIENDEAAFTQLILELDDWTRASAALCQATDSQLDLSTSLPRPTVPPAGTRPSVALIDLSSYGCPVHYMKARLELGKLASGEAIDFLLEAGKPASQVSESLAQDGHSILSSIGHGTHTRVRVQKKHDATTASQSA
jgi:TusA-related sulfurtransferase